jgi:hypothetical protein
MHKSHQRGIKKVQDHASIPRDFLKQIKLIDILHVEAYHFTRCRFIFLGLQKHTRVYSPKFKQEEVTMNDLSPPKK